MTPTVAPSATETDFINTNYQADTDRRATRWIVYAGDRCPPNFKRTFDGMKLGGEYLGADYKTLAPTKGLLRRCQLTPMIMAAQDENADNVGDDKRNVRQRQVYDPEARQSYVQYYYEKYPADELNMLLQSRQQSDDGIREVEILRGIEHARRNKDGDIIPSKADFYQREIFPDWDLYVTGEKEFFRTTGELTSFLNERRFEVSDTAKAIIEVLLESNAQFERWATSELDKQSRLVKAPPTADGKVYGWEPLHVQWFEQLNLNREEFLQQKREEVGETVSNSPSREEFNEMRSAFKELAEVTKNLAEGTIRLANNQNGQAVKAEAKCADFNIKGEPCGAKVVKEIDGKAYCASHPKGE